MGVACSFLGLCLAREVCLGHDYFIILSFLLQRALKTWSFATMGQRVREVLRFSKATSSALGSFQPRI